MTRGRQHAQAIWWAAVEAVRPEPLVCNSVRADPVIQNAPRVLVVGAGKAGAAMARGLEEALRDRLDRIEGLVNVPEGDAAQPRRIRLQFARPAGVNEPTANGVAGAEEMLRLLAGAGPDDIAVCLLSGGGSALLPAPVNGVSLEDKRRLTQLLHRSGATIDEMNCVRKHLSRVKGGRLAEAFHGRQLISLVISDVVGDPLDVIASGPTAPDPTTFRDALAILARHRLTDLAPVGVVQHLERGAQGEVPETPKALPASVANRVIGSNRLALDAATNTARSLGYTILDLGAFVEGETHETAIVAAGIVRSIQRDGIPAKPPACILLGGETTVSLRGETGKGGRNQEFVVSLVAKLGRDMANVTVLSGGTDGEDGPTDAAGGVADHLTWSRLEQLQLPVRDYLDRHDAYRLLEQTDSLLKTGLTGTNVMDVRIILIG
jgi:hydroxypyruvate reductase/glycerate 2-kinase